MCGHSVLLLLFLTACSAASPERNGTSNPPVAEDFADMTEAHNAVRRTARPTPKPSLAPLVESPALVTQARVWAEQCRFEHGRTSSGENLYAASDSPTAQQVVDSWSDEAAAYDYAANRCSGRCGHYTQMVWRDTRQIGCAAHRCTRNSPFGTAAWWLVVCRYEPAGNYVGERPY